MFPSPDYFLLKKFLPLTAAGLDVSTMRILAASYLTECEAADNNSETQRI